MTKTMRMAFAGLLGLFMVGGLPSMSLAQQGDISNQNIPSLEYQDADVREALRALFRTVGVSYTIAPDVQGTITVALKNVTFETALLNILRQVDATYRVEVGIYQIVKREQQPTTEGGGPTVAVPTEGNNVVRVIRIRHADPALIAMLLGKDKGTQSYQAPPELTSLSRMVSGGGGGGGGFGGGMGGMGGGGGFGGGMGGMGGGGFGGGGRGF